MNEHTVPEAVQLDPSDPYAREEQTFPSLSKEMASRVAAYGREERIAKGQVIFNRGERGVDFHLVLDGAIEIFDTDLHGEPQVVRVQGVREFTGELHLFNDRQVLVSARAALESRVVRVPSTEFRRMVSAESDIGEILMRAFILRRVG